MKELRKVTTRKKLELLPKIKLKVQSIKNLQNPTMLTQYIKMDERKLNSSNVLKRKNELLMKKIVLNTLDYHRWDLKRTQVIHYFQDYLVNQYNNNKLSNIRISKSWIIINEEIFILFNIFNEYKVHK